MTERIPCKCCNTPTHPIGALDFNKSCIDRTGAKPFAASGEMVPYNACPGCGFVFTTYMDDWDGSKFVERIYNADYIKADPPIPGRTDVPLKEMPSYRKGLFIATFFQAAKSEIRILDFGSGGNPGPLAQALLDEGFNVTAYEPFRADTQKPEGRYDLIISTEVFEHVNDLVALGTFMKNHLARDGLIWIETLLHPIPTPPNVLDSWYIAPRNGHISIFTLHALTMFMRHHGMNVAQTSSAIVAFRNLPQYPNLVFIRG